MFIPPSMLATSQDIFSNTRFRNGFTTQAGHVPARLIHGKIVDVHPKTWTVDFYSTYDGVRLLDLRIGGPYLHFAQGEGISVMPDIGAQCYVCIPSDSSPPYVDAFVMPMESVSTEEDNAPAGTRMRSSGGEAVDASFAGGRTTPKPGDIFLQGRDGNFVRLHRGGVVQIGAGPLAQRIYLPLNQVFDIAEEYVMRTAAGMQRWGIQEGQADDAVGTEHMSVFRVYRDKTYADMRVTHGKVHKPMRQPTGDDGESSLMSQYGIASDVDSYVVCELAFSTQGFDGENGDAVNGDTYEKCEFHFLFDAKGGLLLRSNSSGIFSFREKLSIKARKDISIMSTEGGVAIKAITGVDIDGGAYAHIKGGVVRIGEGTTPAAVVGSIVQVTIPTAAVSGTLNGQPFVGVIQLTLPANGIVVTGKPSVLL